MLNIGHPHGEYDADEVATGLWMGSAPPTGPWLKQHFDCVVLCSPSYQPDDAMFHGMDVLRCPFVDNYHARPSDGEMLLINKTVIDLVSRLEAGQRVLVTCRMGLNRSGLICAMVRCIMDRDGAMKAISAVRNARGIGALHNPCFVGMLHAEHP